MKIKFVAIIVLFLAVFFSVYAGSRRAPAVTAADTTDECIFMRNVCNYALELQDEVDAMTENDDDERAQKREMLQVLNSSIAHCERARRECTRSVRRKR